MMKKLYLFMLAALTVFVPVSAQNLKIEPSILDMTKAPASDQEFVFGYCLDDYYQSLTYNTPAKGVWAEMAICVPENVAKELAGNKITKLNIGFKNPMMRKIQVFIKENDINSQDTYLQEDVRLQTEGWNELELDTPYEINGKAIYVGFRYQYYKNNTTALALFDTQTINENACWSNFDNAGWNNTDCAPFGSLSLQLVTVGDKTTSPDLGAQNIIIPTSAKAGEDFTATAVTRNFGGKTINNYNLYYSINDGKETKVEVQSNITPNATDSVELTLNIDEPKIETYYVKIRTEYTEDSQDTNNETEKPVVIYTEMPQKKVLFEEFTGMECAYCGEAKEHLATVLAPVQGKYVQINHHTYKGAAYDYYAVGRSIEYMQYFSDKNSAPTCMIDRKYFNGVGIVFDLLGYDEGKTIEDITKNDCFTSIDIQSEYNEDTRMLDITVTGNKLLALDKKLENVGLHVVLIENGQVNWQNSGSGVLKDYVHDNIVRIFVTDAIGDFIGNEQGKFEKKYSVEIPKYMTGYAGPNGDQGQDLPTYLYPENMEVVAYVANFDIEDRNNCEVINANSCKFGDSTVGITQHTYKETPVKVYSNGKDIYVDGENNGIEIYSISGTLIEKINHPVTFVNLSNTNKGLYIIKVNTENANVVSKIYID